MIGAIAGDIIGSVYERNRIKTKQFELFNPHLIFGIGRRSRKLDC
jgi:ADP-ribosylglycohydrolase